jgi:hypothetical protein
VTRYGAVSSRLGSGKSSSFLLKIRSCQASIGRGLLVFGKKTRHQEFLLRLSGRKEGNPEGCLGVTLHDGASRLRTLDLILLQYLELKLPRLGP